MNHFSFLVFFFNLSLSFSFSTSRSSSLSLGPWGCYSVFSYRLQSGDDGLLRFWDYLSVCSISSGSVVILLGSFVNGLVSAERMRRLICCLKVERFDCS